eukprot:2982549-Prymnesium_polylepis.1
MPRRKRLLAGLSVLGNIDPDSRRKIMEMAGLAKFRTAPPYPYKLWPDKRLSAVPLGVLVLEGYQPGDNLDGLVLQVFNMITDNMNALE